jgi:hypothetical protein
VSNLNFSHPGGVHVPPEERIMTMTRTVCVLTGLILLGGVARADVFYSITMWNVLGPDGLALGDGTVVMVLDVDNDGWNGNAYTEQSTGDYNDQSWVFDPDDVPMAYTGMYTDSEARPAVQWTTAELPAGYTPGVTHYYCLWFDTPFDPDAADGGPGAGVAYGASDLGTVVSGTSGLNVIFAVNCGEAGMTTVGNTPPQVDSPVIRHCRLGDTMEISLAAFDPDVDAGVDTLVWAAQIPPGNGTVDVDPDTGLVEYTASSNQTGPDMFQVSVSDGVNPPVLIDVSVVVCEWEIRVRHESGAGSVDVVVGLLPGATEGIDAGMDVLADPQHTIRSLSPGGEYLDADILDNADGRPWLLEVTAGSASGELTWDGDELSEGDLVLRETDETGRPLPGSTVVSMAVTGSLTIESPGTHYFLVSTVRSARIPLDPGWNMVAAPMAPLKENLADTFPDHSGLGGRETTPGAVRRGTAWVWSAEVQRCVPGDRLQALTGTWVKIVETDGHVDIDCTPLFVTEQDMAVGWNLVGSAADASLPLDRGVSGHAWGWDAACRGYRPVQALKAGRAYWIHADTPSSLRLR